MRAGGFADCDCLTSLASFLYRDLVIRRAFGTATGFLLWEKGDFVGGGIKGAFAGVVSVIFERLWYASKERRAGRRNL